jgi:hypothetical protein
VTNLGNLLSYLVLGNRTPISRRRRKAPRGPARDPLYRAFVRTFPCCACGRCEQSEAAHTGHDGGKSQKSSDYSCVPLCFECHFEYDNGMRSKHLFEQDRSISMAKIARNLNRLYFEQRRAA